MLRVLMVKIQFTESFVYDFGKGGNPDFAQHKAFAL